jgi:chaperonin cofactor prefoldin
MESDRKCFRMVGGVLVEHTVDGVVPALTNHKEQVSFNIIWKIIYLLKVHVAK